MNENQTPPVEVNDFSIPDGTQFVIIDLDYKNKRVQVEFMLEGKIIRAWAPASYFEKMTRS